MNKKHLASFPRVPGVGARGGRGEGEGDIYKHAITYLRIRRGSGSNLASVSRSPRRSGTLRTKTHILLLPAVIVIDGKTCWRPFIRGTKHSGL